MTLREARCRFTHLVSLLILWAEAQGFELAAGECYRTKEQQEIYVRQGLSKTMDSRHRDGLAIDFNLYRDGVYMTRSEDHKALGAFWKSLDPHCRWGGDWGWDGNHYELVVS